MPSAITVPMPAKGGRNQFVLPAVWVPADDSSSRPRATPAWSASTVKPPVSIPSLSVWRPPTAPPTSKKGWEDIDGADDLVIATPGPMQWSPLWSTPG